MFSEIQRGQLAVSIVVLLLVVAPLGWLLRDCQRYKGYQLHIAVLLHAAGFDPADSTEAEMQRLENVVRRCYFKRTAAQGRGHGNIGCSVQTVARRQDSQVLRRAIQTQTGGY